METKTRLKLDFVAFKLTSHFELTTNLCTKYEQKRLKDVTSVVFTKNIYIFERTSKTCSRVRVDAHFSYGNLLITLSLKIMKGLNTF